MNRTNDRLNGVNFGWTGSTLSAQVAPLIASHLSQCKSLDVMMMHLPVPASPQPEPSQAPSSPVHVNCNTWSSPTCLYTGASIICPSSSKAPFPAAPWVSKAILIRDARSISALMQRLAIQLSIPVEKTRTGLDWRECCVDDVDLSRVDRLLGPSSAPSQGRSDTAHLPVEA